MGANLQSSSKKSSWQQHLWTFLPILGVYVVLALYGIDRQSLWEDEFNSLKRIASTIPIWKDNHGFLYFALLSFWVELGNSESVLRSLSVFLGALAVCLVYTVGSVLLNRRAAVMATLIFATSPFLIWYSQEARYITLMLLSTLLTMYAFHRAIVRPSFASWVIYSITGLIALFSFVSTVLLLVVQGVHLLGSPSRRPLLRKWLICQIVVIALFGSWLVAGTHFLQAFLEAKASSQQTFINNPKLLPFSGDFNNVRPAVIPYTFFALSTGFSLGPPPRELYADRTFAPLVPYASMLFIIGVLYAGLFLSGLLTLRSKRDAAMLLILWVAIPVLSIFAIAKLLNIFYDVRYVAMVFPAYVLLLAAGIARCRKPGDQLMLAAAVLVVHSIALANYYFDPKYAREDTRSAARFLESAAGPEDVALVVGTLSSLPHYYKGNLPLVNFSRLDRDGQPLPEVFHKVTANHSRLWLVQIRPWQVDRAGRVKAALDNAYSRIQQQHFPGVDVYGYKISN
jgi:mannosyltransferase